VNINNLKIEQPIPVTPLKFLWFVLRQHKLWLFLAVTLVILASGLNTATFYLLKLIVDAVEAGSTSLVVTYVILFPVAFFVAQLLYRASGTSGMRLTVGCNQTATNILSSYLLSHSHSYFINRFAGSITNKIRNVSGGFDELIPSFLWNHLITLISVSVTLLLIWQVSPLVGQILLGLIFILILVNKNLSKRKRELSKLNAETGSRLQAGLVDTYSNMSMIRQYANIDFESANIKRLTADKYSASIKNWFYTEYMLLINVVILFSFLLVMFWQMTVLWQEGLVTSGDLVLVITLSGNIIASLLFLGRAFNDTARAVGEMAEGLDEIMVPIEIEDRPGAKDLLVTEGGVVFDNINFAYNDIPLFQNFFLEIKPGQKVGLVGVSGAGKTTLVSLLLRQHELSGGSIKIDDQDIAMVKQESLRSGIAIVPQEPALFHRTIKDNINYGSLTADLNKVEEAAKLAEADGFIRKLPEAYNTMVGERGVKLSGGQKQRVAIARAILKDSRILVLDEATSALDSESEKQIQSALHELMKGKTVLAIAHRLSTLREMDRIIVLSEGKIIEDGTHDELLRVNGHYATLWNHQVSGFISE
jgi:ATP-binding cassette, subfamily B, bacterial